ncbi:hotdog family protein [Paracraurococcus lichenis]|uniref:MaoC/PaaZ C-terminal domain-containing protein n=1 Tax=Paracraurococcus lichenis TaxID=3064888 RepID=A0ABT9E234_9PROT|nr:MaoC/PaaZ C-terminal domain-containing protein [Paracraurococcus sp. LOR1-02]MDO9710228.1 MaoC/PaaZ C-terminal domain-containing protein [Paracraurococcus sp. LOR1-02]
MAATAYEVRARNLSAQSENRIHDDTVARRFGFRGALVPGVEVYAYACHAAVARWGRAWLEHGTAECRFQSPVYDGDLVAVEAAEAGDGLALTVRREEAVCATGRAALPPPGPLPDPAGWTWRAPPAGRPPASDESLAPGTLLGTAPLQVTPALAAEYLAGVGETDPLYAGAGLVHPGQVLRLCNQALTQNVVLGPWIHVGSQVRNLAAARVGGTLTARARITANGERKGHRIVDLDVLVVEGEGTPVAHVLHTAIWRPRQVA